MISHISDPSFATDYETWKSEMEKCETGLRQFVKEELHNFGTNIISALLFLDRLGRLKLECFHLDRRYFDLALVFVDELKSLKDTLVLDVYSQNIRVNIFSVTDSI